MPVADGKIYRLENKEEGRNTETGQLVMMLQEEFFTEYFRVYCLGGGG
jgi:hypothetical protein